MVTSGHNDHSSLPTNNPHIFKPLKFIKPDIRLLASNRRGRRLRWALGLAFCLHFILAFILPNMAVLNIPAIDRGAVIQVFLQPSLDVEEFDQSLNNPASKVAQVASQRDSLGTTAASVDGNDESISDPAPQQEAERADRVDTRASGAEPTSGLQPDLFITRSMIQFFAQQEAFLVAEREPDDLQRFERSFRSVRSYRKRSKTESFENRYGDYYVRNSSSVGDICYLQEKDQPEVELSTKTVYFFRCNSKPLDFSIDK
jgi:hypothetical protein